MPRAPEQLPRIVKRRNTKLKCLGWVASKLEPLTQLLTQFWCVLYLTESRGVPTQCTPKSENTKNPTLSYTIIIDPINAALATLEL